MAKESQDGLVSHPAVWPKGCATQTHIQVYLICDGSIYRWLAAAAVILSVGYQWQARTSGRKESNHKSSAAVFATPRCSIPLHCARLGASTALVVQAGRRTPSLTSPGQLFYMLCGLGHNVRRLEAARSNGRMCENDLRPLQLRSLARVEGHMHAR